MYFIAHSGSAMAPATYHTNIESGFFCASHPVVDTIRFHNHSIRPCSAGVANSLASVGRNMKGTCMQNSCSDLR